MPPYLPTAKAGGFTAELVNQKNILHIAAAAVSLMLTSQVQAAGFAGFPLKAGQHAIDTKDNFEFERKVALCRSSSVLDLRRKA